MGREVRRVPLDFNEPLKGTWRGYENPYCRLAVQCNHCEGSGRSEEARALEELWYGHRPGFDPRSKGSKPLGLDHPVILDRIKDIEDPYKAKQFQFYLRDLFNSRWKHHLSQEEVDFLAKNERLREFTHNWSSETGWVKKEPAYSPTAEEVNTWSLTAMDHGGTSLYLLVKHLLSKDGFLYECSHCKGEGSTYPRPEDKALAENWERFEPPVGEGWQMWQTVSDGPYTPVFKTPEELARHCAENPWGAEVNNPISYETWLTFITENGYAPSMVLSQGTIKSGVQACVDNLPG